MQNPVLKRIGFKDKEVLSMNLFEDGFKTKEDQIVILNRQGLSVEQIAEKANVSKDKVTSILSSNQNQSKNKINE
jgi:hypothetical protein